MISEIAGSKRIEKDGWAGVSTDGDSARPDHWQEAPVKRRAPAALQRQGSGSLSFSLVLLFFFVRHANGDRTGDSVPPTPSILPPAPSIMPIISAQHIALAALGVIVIAGKWRVP